MKKILLSIAVFALFASASVAQSKYSREQILNMSIEQLTELPLEDLMKAVETLGVSSVDELFSMIMNKNVSSASKEEEDSFKSPLSSTVITRQEMRSYGISTIEEAFRLIPGMIVTEKYNGLYDIQMRGLNNIPDNNTFLYTENANTLLMIDGRPVQNNVMGSINFDMLPIGIEDIERIEVVRGACSALYGANAVNGVINIITERPGELSNTVSGNLQMGNQSTFVGDVALRKAFSSKFAIGLTANIQRRDRKTDKIYLIPNEGQYIPTEYTPEMPSAGSTLTQSQLQELISTSIDASNGGEFSVEQIQSMKQLYPTADGSSYRLFDGTEPESPVSSMFPDPKMSRKTFGVNGYFYFTPSDNTNFLLSLGYQDSHVNGSPCNEDIVAMNGRKSKTGYVNLDANIHNLHIVGNYMGGLQDYVVGVPGYKMKVNNINASVEYDFKFDMGLSVRPGFSFQRMCANDYVPVWNDDDPTNAALADAAMLSNYGYDLSDPGYRSNYKWHYEDPDYGFNNMNYNSLTGLFTGEKDINTVAPSVRVDFKHDALRLIGAYRADKTSNPDKWSHSWQLAASYNITEDNFIRFVYGRANRGANLVNSCADYTWIRTNMYYPFKLRIAGNDDITLMHIDNFEVGYRTRPVKNLLIDAEAFYSISKDYGAMMANYGAMQVSDARLGHILQGINNALTQAGGFDLPLFASDPNTAKYMTSIIFLAMASQVDMGSVMHPYAEVKYGMLPYEVHQMGISLNADYIFSSKLIAKLNANIQRTTIDNYYKYEQISDIKTMLVGAQNTAIQYGAANLPEDILNTVNDYVGSMIQELPAEQQAGMQALLYYITNYQVTGEIPDMLQGIITKGYQFYSGQAQLSAPLWDGTTDTSGDQYKSLVAAANVEWAPVYNQSNGICEFGQVKGSDIRDTNPQKRQNGYKHKGTPSIYGMIGLIYKPVQQLEVSAFCNYIGKRTYNLAYGSFDLGQRCTLSMKVAYKPVKDFEFFVNAHNLLNSQKREFVMNDKIGGIYTVGVNFGF